MWCFEIRNIKTGEQRMIFGYSWNNACRRSGMNPNDDDWRIEIQEYED